jgi:hypothetical protein
MAPTRPDTHTNSGPNRGTGAGADDEEYTALAGDIVLLTHALQGHAPLRTPHAAHVPRASALATLNHVATLLCTGTPNAPRIALTASITAVSIKATVVVTDASGGDCVGGVPSPTERNAGRRPSIIVHGPEGELLGTVPTRKRALESLHLYPRDGRKVLTDLDSRCVALPSAPSLPD